MKTTKLLCTFSLILGLAGLLAGQSQKSQAGANKTEKKPLPLKLVQTISLPGVEGRIDHMNVDVQGKRLFMAALGNQSVEIVDLAAGKPLHSIGGLGGDPEGIVYVPQSNMLFVAAGTPGVNIYDGTTYKLIRSVPAPNNDNLRLDPQSASDYGAGLVFVTVQKGLRALDSRDGKFVYDINITSDGPRPEAFQVEKLPGSRRLFANMTYQGYIAVADLAKKGQVVAQWPVQGFKEFFPMTLDEQDHRLFIGSRAPASLVVYDTTSGKMVANMPGMAHTDDIFYDAAHKRVYMMGGEGAIGIFQQRDPDHYDLIGTAPTVPGASTGFFSPELNQLYVPTTRYAGQPAKVLVFEPQS
jgi:hypothetical protein